jgi:uncharacterized protein (TIGR03083 family)
MMEYREHCEAVAREVDALVEAVAAGPADAAVPTCPGWSVADLVEHTGLFTGFWTHVLCEGTGRPKTPFPKMAEADTIAEWYAEMGAHLLRELSATSPDQTVWSWVPDRQNAAFVARRCAHELAVHRYDAQSARSAARPIEGGLAEDGIDEIFVMIHAFAAEDKTTGRGNGERLSLEPTDRPARWLVQLTSAGLRINPDDSACDLVLRGATSDLELLLYERPTIARVERVGDQAALGAWYRGFHFG